ncbi:hypothetical protein CL629_04285 [bacterium]|nr:hypothetical protein [bacterium]
MILLDIENVHEPRISGARVVLREKSYIIKSMQIITRYLLFGIALMPLITLNLPFGTIVWKIFYMRILIELAIILFCIQKIRGARTPLPWRHPIVLLLGAYTVSFIISMVGAVSPYRAIWGNLERGEGLITWFHYIAFFLLMLLMWKKDDWIKMFRLSLIVGIILMLYGALQYFHVSYFPPFYIMSAERPMSLVGNTAFFATHLIFVMMMASIVYVHAKRVGSHAWKYIAALGMIAAIPMIFTTGTRGTIIGIVAGGMVALGYICIKNLIQQDKERKKKGIIACAALIAISGTALFFVMTKDISFWKVIPQSERLISPLSQGIKGTSGESRLILWRMSFEAWKERPIFGWGQENYLPAFEKYFDPQLDKTGETWFDRSHNNIVDITVTQGIVGLVIYIALMGAIVCAVIKKRKKGLIEGVRPYLMWGLVAYVVQNLLLFDQPLSYLHLMMIAGFLIAWRKDDEEVSLICEEAKQADLSPACAGMAQEEEEKEIPPSSAPKASAWVSKGAYAVIGIIAAYAIYAWNVTPFKQIQYVEAAKKTPNQEEIFELLEKGFYPYNFAQHDLRAHIVDHEYSFQPELFMTPGFEELSSFFLESIREAREKDSADPRMLIREIQVLILMSTPKPELIQEAEKLAREGIEQAPEKTVFYHKLALILANQGRYEEARDAAEAAIAIYPEASLSHFQLGLVLAMGGDSYHEDAVKAFEEYERLDPNSALGREANNYALVYTIWGDYKKVAEMALQVAENNVERVLSLDHFQTALAYYTQEEQKQEFLEIAQFMESRFPDFAESLEIYIDLAERENWRLIREISQGEE